MTEEEKKQLADAKDMKQMLKDQMQQTMQQLQEKADDPNTPEAARRQMQEMAQRMNQALEEMKKEQSSAQMWQQIVEADQAKAALEALAKGESLPDDQWNKLMSKLDDGLGQVGGRTPPEDYRRAIEQYQERIRRLTGAASE
jgi:HSP90 family molecular chaperone